MRKVAKAMIGLGLLLHPGAVAAENTGATYIKGVKAWPGFVHLVLEKGSTCGGGLSDHYTILEPAKREHLVSLSYAAWSSGRRVDVQFTCRSSGAVPGLGASQRNVVEGVRALY